MDLTANMSRAQKIALCALCIALLIASCFFTIPLGPVPFTLQTAVVMLVALLFGPKLAFATTGIYVLMGAVGLPVFSGMMGGLGKLLGPTGGFLFSYPIGSCLASLLRQLLERRQAPQLLCDTVCVAGIIVCSDTLGWLWLMVSAQMDPLAAFLTADAPFIAVDCIKGVVAVGIARAVRAGLAA